MAAPVRPGNDPGRFEHQKRAEVLDEIERLLAQRLRNKKLTPEEHAHYVALCRLERELWALTGGGGEPPTWLADLTAPSRKRRRIPR